MARLLVEIDTELKRELKIRLIREGETLKSWLTRMARSYLEDHAATKAPAPRSPAVGARAASAAPASAAVPPATPRAPVAAPAPEPIRQDQRSEVPEVAAPTSSRPIRRYDDYLD